MKRLLAIAVLLCGTGVSLAQTPANNMEPSNAERAPRYSFAAAPRGCSPDWADSLKFKLNPTGTDYGAIWAEAERGLVEMTVEKMYFWVTLLMFVALVLLGGNNWMLRLERSRRLQIAGGILAQVVNSYLHARRKATEAIRRHNDLVDVCDRQNAEREALIGMQSAVAPEKAATETRQNENVLAAGQVDNFETPEIGKTAEPKKDETSEEVSSIADGPLPASKEDAIKVLRSTRSRLRALQTLNAQLEVENKELKEKLAGYQA